MEKNTGISGEQIDQLNSLKAQGSDLPFSTQEHMSRILFAGKHIGIVLRMSRPSFVSLPAVYEKEEKYVSNDNFIDCLKSK